ncbi:MAG: hypothetical protein H7A47_00765 [Verrucomicrobiales bacterium]|nr:hypothetical protein [Verrucomicrobiales bacterium]
MAHNSDAIRRWFSTAESLGECIGIRFGRLAPGASEPEWFLLPHSEVDGIGGLADLLRRRGAALGRLPRIHHFSRPAYTALLRTTPRYLAPRRPTRWGALPGDRRPSTKDEPPSSVAWHVFDEDLTAMIRRVCRKAGYTVNSFLLKHLARAIRPSLHDQTAPMPWMVPVNLRGAVSRSRDTDNHSSYVSVRVRSWETVYDVHRSIYAALASGEHWAHWWTYKTGNFLPRGVRAMLVRRGRAVAQLNIGSFSNLGLWDSDRQINQPECLGGWLFAPPVLRCQMVGAGAVTFQHRLGLVIQVHPELTTDPAVPEAWMRDWIREMEIDMDAVTGAPMVFHASPLWSSTVAGRGVRT